jgi:hypothetical protein
MDFVSFRNLVKRAFPGDHGDRFKEDAVYRGSGSTHREDSFLYKFEDAYVHITYGCVKEKLETGEIVPRWDVRFRDYRTDRDVPHFSESGNAELDSCIEIAFLKADKTGCPTGGVYHRSKVRDYGNGSGAWGDGDYGVR